MAATGRKAQGQAVHEKLYVVRHGHGPRRGCNAAEKAIETRVRQAGKREVYEALRAVPDEDSGEDAHYDEVAYAAELERLSTVCGWRVT
jgi:hypothetical protein